MSTEVKRNDGDYDSDSGDLACMNVLSINKITNPCVTNLKIDGCDIKMEVDCGAAVSAISKNQYFAKFSKTLKKSATKIVVVNGSGLKLLGEVDVFVKFRNQRANLKLLVLDCVNDFYPLMGRIWLDGFIPNWRQFFNNSISINNVSEKENIIQNIKQKFPKLFVKDFTTPINCFEAELILKTNTPIFKKAYDVPYRLREKVLTYLDKLEKE